jgi:hypothetical protein
LILEFALEIFQRLRHRAGRIVSHSLNGIAYGVLVSVYSIPPFCSMYFACYRLPLTLSTT